MYYCTRTVENVRDTEVEPCAKVTGTAARAAGEQLGEGAKGLGQSIWEGMKSGRRSLQRFFSGSFS